MEDVKDGGTGQSPRIGWIGIGAMGRPMCLNLIKAGHVLTVFDRVPTQCEAVVAAGARTARSVQELVAQSDVVFSTIFDDAGLRALFLSDGGAGDAASAGQIFVDMSTVSPQASAEVAAALAQRGASWLRAPVSGTVSLAASAQLSCFVSGPRQAFDAVQPLLARLSARQSYVGAADEARVIKLMINMMVFMSTAVIGEGLAFGARAGLDRALMIDAINDSIVGSPHYRTKADKLKQREYGAVGPISLVVKDLDMALDVARDNVVPLPISSLVRQYLAMMQHRDLGHLDIAALADVPAWTGAPGGTDAPINAN
ncbi:NAD(P)-dependent oxidoreductase [Cupriavidus sp. MP-37]|uniref:NAD(P)-dependent oxidoreductase n=1 Tax=Cupriavidus sp. MP-37 TaxID=2884455 RepID=UPI001D0B4658|nr:NAD(P)-dependent oxidoreductase [Cupriavidus sp. MP-37]UDM52682.1 NAD(P)-dependent oxidoreductase [Cupriavidus sp. MP-37]